MGLAVHCTACHKAGIPDFHRIAAQLVPPCRQIISADVRCIDICLACQICCHCSLDGISGYIDRIRICSGFSIRAGGHCGVRPVDDLDRILCQILDVGIAPICEPFTILQIGDIRRISADMFIQGC